MCSFSERGAEMLSLFKSGILFSLVGLSLTPGLDFHESEVISFRTKDQCYLASNTANPFDIKIANRATSANDTDSGMSTDSVYDTTSANNANNIKDTTSTNNATGGMQTNNDYGIDIEKIAWKVIRGEYGNTRERDFRLAEEELNPQVIQEKVNEILAVLEAEIKDAPMSGAAYRGDETTSKPVANDEQQKVSNPVITEGNQAFSKPNANEEQQAMANPAVDDGQQTASNPYRERRKYIESRGDYQTFTGNGYLGAYQFAPTTWKYVCEISGTNENDFSPYHQDQMADLYAEIRYGGWENTPISGGW